jgi:hypothetical protein
MHPGEKQLRSLDALWKLLTVKLLKRGGVKFLQG